VIAVNDSVKSKFPICVSKEEKDENLFFTNHLTTKHQMQKLFSTNQIRTWIGLYAVVIWKGRNSYTTSKNLTT